jgi:Ca2+ transporting ATPase
MVKVRRNNETELISIYHLHVGDIMSIGTGDTIAVDGLLIQGHDVRVDQSNVTGETDLLRKNIYRAGDDATDPFLISGSRVAEGSGKMVVCCVGEHSYYGKSRKMISASEEEGTPLQESLETIAGDIGKVGFVVAIFTVIALTIHIMIDSFALGDGWTTNSWRDLLDALIIGITIIVVAVPEGLPLAVTISLAYSVGKMRDEKNLVRHLHACESMGCANNICSDKTGTLTENRMNVVSLYLHGEAADLAHVSQLSDCTKRGLSRAICVNSTA